MKEARETLTAASPNPQGTNIVIFIPQSKGEGLEGSNRAEGLTVEKVSKRMTDLWGCPERHEFAKANLLSISHKPRHITTGQSLKYTRPVDSVHSDLELDRITG